MLHIVPILCLILFVGLVEYRLKKHLDETNERIRVLEKSVVKILMELRNIQDSLDNYEDSGSK